MKVRVASASDIEKTRRLLKQFLYALRISEGFGEQRLLRVLQCWAEVYKEVDNDENNEMMLIDEALDRVCPSHLITKSIGKEQLKNKRGKAL